MPKSKQRKLKNPFKITKTIVERFESLHKSDIGYYAILLPHSPVDPMVYETKHIADKSWTYFKKTWKLDD